MTIHLERIKSTSAGNREGLTPAMNEAKGIVCWCNNDDPELCFRTSHFGLIRCRSCSCYRIDPPPLQRPSEASEFYTKYYIQPSEECNLSQNRRQSRYWQVVEQIPDLAQIHRSVLDVGCGAGDLCHELSQAGWPVVIGQDVSRSRVAKARSIYTNVRFYDVPIEETDISIGSQDLIIIDNVIEHIPNPVEFLTTLRNYLRPSGLLVAITPNMESGNFRLLGRRWIPELAPHAHIFLFTQAAMRLCIELSGFDVCAQGSFHTEMASPGKTFRRLLKGDLKGALWRIIQRLGSLYSRVIKSGPMLFLVATPRNQG